MLKVLNGYQNSGPAPVHEILDLGLPPIRNVSSSTVTLRSVQVVSLPKAIRLLNVRAYLWDEVGFGYLQNAFGNLAKNCPGKWTPYPMRSVVTRPHSDSRWMVVLSLTISKPGTYHLHKVKINYMADGKRGWQYQNLDTVIKAFHGHDPVDIC